MDHKFAFKKIYRGLEPIITFTKMREGPEKDPPMIKSIQAHPSGLWLLLE